MDTIFFVLLGLAIVGTFEALFYLTRFLSDRKTTDLRRRLQALGTKEGMGGLSLLRVGKLSRIPAIDEALRALNVARTLEAWLEQADLGITVAQLLFYSALAGTVAFIGGLALGLVLSLQLVMAIVAFSGPILYVLFKRTHRSNKISEQLPEALEMMARSLRAGHALQGAFQLVAGESPEPINVEFGRAYEEQRLGRTLDQAVVSMTTRVPENADLKIFAVSVVVQKETGGNLAEILDKIAETIRSRYRFYGKLRALTAEGRVSGLILGVLPLAMAGFLMIANPTYVSTLVTTKLGNLFLLYAIVSWMVGLFWLFRMTKVEF
ncbi:type II secretion system F family protein [Myxococcota bacterium]